MEPLDEIAALSEDREQLVDGADAQREPAARIEITGRAGDYALAAGSASLLHQMR
ncbi:hypothetical protein [Nocardia callitridis]|uniref:Uncharacterized protein n=1 Tax=Nocardia callitridis TaxID=648753 RepID=A0ABP9JX23_9NOCA